MVNYLNICYYLKEYYVLKSDKFQKCKVETKLLEEHVLSETRLHWSGWVVAEPMKVEVLCAIVHELEEYVGDKTHKEIRVDAWN